jgi:opacity protein-like surface antigen
MKKVLLGAAMLAALSAGSAFAADAARPVFTPPPPPAPVSNWQATIDMYGGATWVPDLGADGDPIFLGGGGAAAFNMPGGGGIQLDVIGEGGYFDSEYGYATAVLGGHVFKRGSMGALGVLANITNYADAYNEYGYFRFAAGVEGQWYLPMFTLYGQAAYLGKIVDDCDCASTGWFGKVEGRWFVNPNAMLALRGEVYNGEIYEDGDTYRRATIGLKGEFKMSNPVSIFGDVAWSHNTHTGSTAFNDVTAKLGLTLNLNAASLLDRDRHGPSFTQPFVGVGEMMGLWEF